MEGFLKYEVELIELLQQWSPNNAIQILDEYWDEVSKAFQTGVPVKRLADCIISATVVREAAIYARTR